MGMRQARTLPAAIAVCSNTSEEIDSTSATSPLLSTLIMRCSPADPVLTTFTVPERMNYTASTGAVARYKSSACSYSQSWMPVSKSAPCPRETLASSNSRQSSQSKASRLARRRTGGVDRVMKARKAWIGDTETRKAGRVARRMARDDGFQQVPKTISGFALIKLAHLAAQACFSSLWPTPCIDAPRPPFPCPW